jgi:glycosyltransferase involved in cell wall biosynthesis
MAQSRLRSIAQSWKPDVAVISQFAYHFSPSAFSAVAGIPIVVLMMDYKAICPLGTRLLPDGVRCTHRAGVSCMTHGCISLPHWMRDQPRYARIRAALSRASRVICPSEWMRQQFRAAGVETEVVRFGVAEPVSWFQRAASPQPKFVYCGRLSPEKGVALLLRAFAKFVADVPHASLRLLGDGPQRKEIDRLIDRLGIRLSVSMSGWISPAEVELELHDAWALVAPSLWAEPFGLAVVEAMTRGVPVIASESGAFLETVTPNVTGIFFESGNEAALVQALRRIAMGSTFPSRGIDPHVVRSVRDRFSLAAHADQLRSILREAAHENRASA